MTYIIVGRDSSVPHAAADILHIVFTLCAGYLCKRMGIDREVQASVRLLDDDSKALIRKAPAEINGVSP